MSQKILGVLAIVLIFGSAELPTSAFARDGRYGDSSLGSRGHPSAGGIGTAGGYSSEFSRISGEPGGFHEFGRDAWGHWGAYYGPMIHGL
jgi:hypothetical protein